jgi:DNA topoisomerase-6 subunit B
LHLSINNEIDEQLGGNYRNLPEVPTASKPHPRAADLELMRRLASQQSEVKVKEWLIDSFQKVGEKTASAFLRFIGMDPKIVVSSLSREDLVRLSTGLRKYDRFESPDSSALEPIGKDAFIAGVSSAFSTSIQYYSKRPLSEYQGNPFVLEAVLTVGDDFPRSDTPTLYRFANRVPLLYDLSDDILTKALRRVNWSRYDIKSSSPVALFVNLNSTRVPFKAAGKQSIASVPEIEQEAVALFRDLGRRLGKAMKKHLQSTRDARRLREFTKSLRLLAKFSAELAETDVPGTAAIVNRLVEGEIDE